MEDWWIRTEADKRAVREGCYFDLRAAEKVKSFVSRYCTLGDGERAGQPVELLPWVWRDIVMPLYGWKKPDGSRRYRRGSCWTPRKQSKTTTLACLSLWNLLEEAGVQSYCISSTIETASHIYNMAADMVERSPALSKRLWLRRHVRMIEDKSTKSFLKVLSGDRKGKSGQNTHSVFWVCPLSNQY